MTKSTRTSKRYSVSFARTTANEVGAMVNEPWRPICMSDQPILLIDGRNCAYRAVFANRTGNQNNKCHTAVVMLRFITSWIEKFKPLSIHVFWDANRNTVWRRKIFEGYKKRDELDLTGVIDDLNATTKAIMALFTVMNIRQFKRKEMEADDLIYAACRVLHPQDVIVVSSDGDFQQLLHFFPNTKLYEPRKNEFVSRPDFNPVIRKALWGDEGDRINGYQGIGEVKSLALAKSVHNRLDFLGKVGSELFNRNLLLVDLNLCPDLLANEQYVTKVMATDVEYDRSMVHSISMELKLMGLMTEYDRFAARFKGLK